MSVQVETIGYKFRVSKGTSVFDIISTTELGITKSNEIVRAFFDNFSILKSDRITKQEEVANNESKLLSIASGEAGKLGESPVVKPARKKREAMKNMWGNLRELLGDEFTIADYTKALRDAGYEYTPGSWEAVPGQQLTKLAKLGKIEKIEGSKPMQYRKIKVPHSFRNDQMAEKTVKALKAGEKVILGSIQ